MAMTDSTASVDAAALAAPASTALLLPNGGAAASSADDAAATPATARARPATRKPRKAKAGKPKRSGKAAKGKPAKTPAPLLAELDALHAAWHDALAAHRLKGEARFLEVRRAIRGEKGAAFKVGSGKEAKRLAAALKRLKLKPKKGRARDLRKVDHLLSDLLGHVDD
jgi:hypothetical protein